MPKAVYHNDGSGRDSYINGACFSQARQTASSNPNAALAAGFWPKESPRRGGGCEPLSLNDSTSTMATTPRSTVPSPQSKRTSGVPLIPSISPRAAAGQYASPQKQLQRYYDGGFAAKGCISPRSPQQQPQQVPSLLPSPRGTGPMESSAQHAARTGRFDTPRGAPPCDGKLPALKLHQKVGVLSEV